MKLDRLDFNVLCALLIVISFPAFSQGVNLIPNPSFENGDDQRPLSINPNLVGLLNWTHFGSSDWIQNGNGTPADYYPDARTGEYIIGFGHCEGAQVSIPLPVLTPINARFPYYVVESGFYYQTRNSTPTLLNLYYSQFPLTLSNDCENPVDPSDIYSHVEVEIPANSDEEWHYVSASEQEGAILVSQANLLQAGHIAIKGENIQGIGGSQGYIHIDDFEYTVTDICAHPCHQGEEILAHYSTIDPITNQFVENYDPDLSNGVFDVNVSNDQTAFLTVKNAKYVKVEVQNRWGEIMTTQFMDPNGLSNANYNHNFILNPDLRDFIENRPDLFTILLEGSWMNEGYGYIEDVYTIKVTLQNCNPGYTKIFHESITITGSSGQNGQAIYSPTNQVYTNCCEPGKRRYQYNVHLPNFTEHKQEEIEIFDDSEFNKEYYDYSGTSGLYVDVSLEANNKWIDISPASTSSFEIAASSECTPFVPSYEGVYNKMSSEGGYVDSLNTSMESQIFITYPSPAADIINYNSSDFGSHKLIIYNVIGEVVMKKSVKNNPETTIIVSKLKSGIYLCLVLDEQGQKFESKFVKL